MLINNSCEEFTAKLASTDAVPGGGGAAALCGALSVSLCSMAAGFTAGKKKFAEYADELQTIIAECDDLRKEFLRLMDKDAECFAPLAKAYSLPKDSPDYAEILRTATLNAVQPPMKMLTASCQALALIEKLCDGKCSKLLISDAGCAAALCGAAMQCAAMNVFVNTKTLRGDAETQDIEVTAKSLLKEFLPKAEAISQDIINKLSED